MENSISLRSKKAMTKEEYIALTLSKWEQLEALKERGNLYDYEKEFDELWVDLGRSVLEKSISEVPNNRRKKKKLGTRYGSIEIARVHAWSEGIGGYQMSPYLQELYAYGGQSDNYQESCEQMTKYLRIAFNTSQMERITQHYGAQYSFASPDFGRVSTRPERAVAESERVPHESWDSRSGGSRSPLPNPSLESLETPLESAALLPESMDLALHFGGQALLEQMACIQREAVNPQGTIYCMMDGSMIQTREGTAANDWKEVKLGRIFRAEDLKRVDKHHHQIAKSLYLAHLGTSNVFTKQLEMVLNTVLQSTHPIVFINDGSTWIWNWIEEHCPGCTQILDFYHLKEKLSAGSKYLFNNPTESHQWLDQQIERLFQDDVPSVLADLKTKLSTLSKTKAQEVGKVRNYILNNQKRITYKTFLEQGFLIGSGPIESAHRVVLQKRLKQSGQRWTQKGAQNVMNLRVLHQSGLWNHLINQLKIQAKPIPAQTA
jgi:hypothetical protein